MCKIIGIDISKQTFDVSFKRKEQWNHFIFPNEEKGFKQLLKLIEQGDWVVMEASGSYYFPLASRSLKHINLMINSVLNSFSLIYSCNVSYLKALKACKYVGKKSRKTVRIIPPYVGGFY